MNTETKFGKIGRIHYGFCGYQNAMLGLSITIEGDGWGVGADKPGAWTTKRSPTANWTEEDRINSLGRNAMEICQLLHDAKVDSVEKLKGIPVEVIFDGMKLKSWRILKEVL